MIYESERDGFAPSFYIDWPMCWLPFAAPVTIKKWDDNELLGQINESLREAVVTGSGLEAQLQYNTWRLPWADTVLVDASGNWLGFRRQQKQKKLLSLRPLTHRLLLAESLSKEETALVLAVLVADVSPTGSL